MLGVAKGSREMQSTGLGEDIKVHLWVYNHPLFGISDQVAFFVMAFSQNGYEVTVGEHPRSDALNVVIENFSKETKETLQNFCRENHAKVAIIMTEHIDFISDKLFFHGEKLWTNSDYMHPTTQIIRLRNLISLQPFIKFFFVLGDLPELRNIEDVLTGIEVRKIPFPKLVLLDNSSSKPEFSFLFTGFHTEYRRNLMDALSGLDLEVRSPMGFVSHEKRDEMNAQAKLILNIPQRKGWRWLSSMRILAALTCGRATVSLGTNDTCEMSKCTYQIDIEQTGWSDLLASYVNDWQGLYEKAHADYTAMAVEFERKHPFPHDLMEFWAITDGISSRRASGSSGRGVI
jgi:hypothetical protein